MTLERWWHVEVVRRQLVDLLDTAALGAELIARGKSNFSEDRLLQAAGEALVIRTGEACQRLPRELTDEFPEVPWREIIDMRHIVAHTYRIVDPQLIWSVLAEGLPDLLHELGLADGAGLE